MRRLAKWVAGIGVALAFAPAAAQAEELDWQPCDPGFQCATASVPRDYAHPRGPEVQIALIRRPASDPEHRIGSIFVNPGGPGAPASTSSAPRRPARWPRSAGSTTSSASTRAASGAARPRSTAAGSSTRTASR